MSKKEESAREYSFNIPSKIYNTLETHADRLLWKSEAERAFESGWDACVEDLYKNKGFPVDLNGNVVSYEEAMKNIELFNKHMKEEFLGKACNWFYEQLFEGTMECKNIEALITDFKIKMEG